MDYHAHIYFEDHEQAFALTFKNQLAAHFPHSQGGRSLAFPQMAVGRFHVRIGPHTKAMFQVAYAQADAAALMAYFDAHIPERSVLIHPLIDDVLAAHTTEAKWRGPILPLNLEALLKSP